MRTLIFFSHIQLQAPQHSKVALPHYRSWSRQGHLHKSFHLLWSAGLPRWRSFWGRGRSNTTKYKSISHSEIENSRKKMASSCPSLVIVTKSSILIRRIHLQNFNLSFKSSLRVHSQLPAPDSPFALPWKGAPRCYLTPPLSFLPANTTFSYII